jgi:hypothetical protein
MYFFNRESETKSANQQSTSTTVGKSPNPPNSDTWFFELTGSINDAWIEFLIFTPGVGCREIRLEGSSLAYRSQQNQTNPTNQIHQTGNCGILGYATPQISGGFSIYTITTGVCNPQIHPPL